MGNSGSAPSCTTPTPERCPGGLQSNEEEKFDEVSFRAIREESCCLTQLKQEGVQAAVLSGAPSHKLELEKRMEDIERRLRVLETKSFEDPVRSVGLSIATEKKNSGAASNSHGEEVEHERSYVPQSRLSKASSKCSLDDIAVDQVIDNHMGHEIKESCWEASAFLGHGMGANICILLGIFLAMGGQCLFLYVLTHTEESFVLSMYPDVESVQAWRYTVGHNQRHMIGGSSLVSAVCSGSQLLTEATNQADLTQDMRSYGDGIEHFSPGAILATFSVFLWFLTVWGEVRECASFTCGICLAAKQARKTSFRSRQDLETGEIGISFSFMHFAFVMFLCCARMAIALALFVTGAWWLSVTLNISDLVLNASALGFVMELDELLYTAFIPDVIKSLQRQAEKLPSIRTQRSKARLRGMDLWPALAFFAALIAVGIPFSFLIYPQLQNIGASLEMMCGGDQDFVYIDMHHFPQLARLQSDGGSNPSSGTDEFQVRYLSNYSTRSNRSEQAWLRFLDVEKAVSAGPLSLYPKKCLDEANLHEVELREDSVDFVPFLQAYTGLDAVSTCAEVKENCTATSAFWVRFLCPKTCGCDIYRGPLWVRDGCPQTCEESDEYWRQKADLPCKDIAASALMNDSIWSSWWVGNWSPWYSSQWEGFRRQEIPGCEVLNSSEAGLLPELLCAYGNAAQFSGSLRLFCPETCGCRDGDDGCPYSCHSLT